MTPAEAAQAAEALRLTAPDLYRLGVIDLVIPEPRMGAHKHHRATAKVVARQVQAGLREIEGISPEERLRARRRKFLAMGMLTPADAGL